MKRLWHIINLYESFRVVYPTGGRTVRLSHLEARNLQEMFGGKIVFDPAK